MEEVHYGGEGPYWAVLSMKKKKHTGKRPLGRPRRRWEDNIRMDLNEIGINWVNSAQDWDY